MLAIAGGKGGCGKTTTTVGLASAFARRDRRVVAADAERDLPDLHRVAGVDAEPNLSTVAAGTPVEAVAHSAPDRPGVAVVPGWPGPHSPADARAALARLAGAADRVLLDCPAGAGPDAVAPLAVADATLLVTTRTAASLTDAAKTAAMARELGAPVRGVVVTRTDAAPDGVDALLDCPVLACLPEVDAPVASAPAVRRACRRVAADLSRSSRGRRA